MRPSGDPVFLIGFMGSGKTTVGRWLAGKLKRPFLDTDAEVEQRTGLSVPQIFRDQGESRFREIETEVLRRAGMGSVVVATGGGIVDRAANRRWLGLSGATIWLDAPLSVLRQRVGEGVGRPLWAPEDPVWQRVFFEKRRAAYALVGIRIDAARGPIEEVGGRALKYVPSNFP